VEPIFFETPAEFRDWLAKNHEKEKELLVGFYKKGSGKPSMTWPESVGEALCFGWIDGVRKSHCEESYTIRFTPRKPNSIWSNVNVRKVAELTQKGLMRPAGIAAYNRRSESKSGIYSFENAAKQLTSELEGIFKANQKAWDFFHAQPPGYRKLCIDYIMNAKQERTQLSRLEKLIEASHEQKRVR